MNFKLMMMTNKEFFQQACRWKDSTSVQTAAQWWAAFQEVIVRELFYNGTCKMPGLGRFGVEQRDGGYVKRKDAKGKSSTYFVPPRVVPIFTPEDDFINDINMQGVTKAYRKRLRKGELSQRDYERELRAETMDSDAMLDEIMEQRRENAQVEFQKLLASKRKDRADAVAKRSTYTVEPKPVVQMDLDGNVLAIFPSMSEATKATGVDTTHISYVCAGKRNRKTAAGYRWRYANDEEKEELENDKFNESEACDTES